MHTSLQNVLYGPGHFGLSASGAWTGNERVVFRIARAHLSCSIRGSQIAVCLERIIQVEKKRYLFLNNFLDKLNELLFILFYHSCLSMYHHLGFFFFE